MFEVFKVDEDLGYVFTDLSYCRIIYVLAYQTGDMRKVMLFYRFK